MKRLLFDEISAMRMKSCIMCFWRCHFIFAYMDLILPPSFSLFLNLSLSFPFLFLHAHPTWWPLSCCRSTARRPSALPDTESKKSRCQKKERSKKKSQALRASGKTGRSLTSQLSFCFPWLFSSLSQPYDLISPFLNRTPITLWKCFSFFSRAH